MIRGVGSFNFQGVEMSEAEDVIVGQGSKVETEASLRQVIEKVEPNKDIWGRVRRPRIAPDIKGRDV